MAETTLENADTPWAECYRGSGRLTGRLAAEPVRTARGDVAPGWTWVGGMTFADFEDEQEIGEHDQFHSPSRAGAGCRLCEEAGWQNC